MSQIGCERVWEGVSVCVGVGVVRIYSPFLSARDPCQALDANAALRFVVKRAAQKQDHPTTEYLGRQRASDRLGRLEHAADA